MFRFIDLDGVRRTVYSWKLVETDKAPEGKRSAKSLREMEAEIQENLTYGVLGSTQTSAVTVNDLFQKFLSLRVDLKETTKCNYSDLYKKHVSCGFGQRKITAVKYSDVVSLYNGLAVKEHLNLGTIEKIHAFLYQVFEVAVLDHMIRINPTANAMKNLRKALAMNSLLKQLESGKRAALTLEEQQYLIDYIYGSNIYVKWGPLFTVLLGTGMRIGEALGLRWSDVDFEEKTIHINHTLNYKRTLDKGYHYFITSPKTENSIRVIPMFSAVERALYKQKEFDDSLEIETPFSIGEYSGFVFLNSNGKPIAPHAFFETIQRIVESFNKREEAAKSDRRLPRFSAHTLRHTFCTRLCEIVSDQSAVQEIMGHKSIQTTINIYDSVSKSRTQNRIKDCEGLIKLD